jgi:hypothetical protein
MQFESMQPVRPLTCKVPMRKAVWDSNDDCYNYDFSEDGIKYMYFCSSLRKYAIELNEAKNNVIHDRRMKLLNDPNYPDGEKLNL